MGVILLTLFVVLAQFFRVWLQAYMSNAGVTFYDLIGMRLRKVPMTTIVSPPSTRLIRRYSTSPDWK